MSEPFSVDAILSKVFETSFETLDFTDRKAGVICPACQAALHIAALGEIKVAACPQCKGVLIETDAFASTIRDQRSNFRGADKVPVPIDPKELQVKRSCPSCAENFETHPYHGPGNVIIDSCMPCRLIWLDLGELSDIIKSPGKRD